MSAAWQNENVFYFSRGFDGTGIAAGLDPAALGELRGYAERTVRDHGLPSAQLALARDGQVVAELTIGRVDADTRYVVFSVTKALVAAGVWLLFGDGLDPDLRIVDVVPEFGTNGKDRVTLAHCLLHTAGFPRAPMRPEEGVRHEDRMRRFASWRLDWEPGTRSEYHATSAHWVVAEVVERVTGRSLRDFLAERVTGPLGLHALRLGEPPEDQEGIAEIHIVGTPPDDVPGDLAAMLRELSPTYLVRFNEPEVLAAGVPGAGAVARAADIAVLYQSFLHNPGGLWDPKVLADATGTVRNDYPDPWTGVPAHRTLGLVVAGDDGNAALRDFGTGTGPRAFGAAGVGGQIAWADPDTGLSFCFLTNGLAADLARAFRRSSKLSTLAAACVSAGSTR